MVQRNRPYEVALILALKIESITAIFCCWSPPPSRLQLPKTRVSAYSCLCSGGGCGFDQAIVGQLISCARCDILTRVTKTRTNYRCRWLKPRQAQQSTFPSWPCLTKGGFGNREGQHAGLGLTRRRLIKQNASMNLHSCLLSFKHRSVIILINGGRATVSKLQMALAREYKTKPPWPRQRQIPLDKVGGFYQNFDNLLIVGFVVFS